MVNRRRRVGLTAKKRAVPVPESQRPRRDLIKTLRLRQVFLRRGDLTAGGYGLILSTSDLQPGRGGILFRYHRCAVKVHGRRNNCLRLVLRGKTGLSPVNTGG